MKQIIFAIIFGMFFSVSVSASSINSFLDMPSDSTILFPIYQNAADSSPFINSLNTNDIQHQLWSDGSWVDVNSMGSGTINYFPANKNSQIAPHGNTLYFGAVRFIFNDPVYALGGTFFATNNPPIDIPNASFDNNVENVQYAVAIYDEFDNPIGTTYSSSYNNIIGPVEYGTAYGGVDYMTSWAGFWTNTPIYSATFFGEGTRVRGNYGGFAFSRTPNLSPVPVPEPSTLLLTGLSLFIASRCRKKLKGIKN